jgi:Holliday junction resolvasome RuvABC ATP-dependent DNA helicase subunit
VQSGRITKVTRHLRPRCGILMSMKTKNMRELEKMWAKKAMEQGKPQQKGGASTRQTISHAPRISRKSNRGS